MRIRRRRPKRLRMAQYVFVNAQTRNRAATTIASSLTAESQS